MTPVGMVRICLTRLEDSGGADWKDTGKRKAGIGSSHGFGSGKRWESQLDPGAGGHVRAKLLVICATHPSKVMKIG